MRLDLDGEPIHTRALGVLVARRPDGRLDARGSLLDLRTRGFLPVGGSLQGMGIIHHMELAWTVDPTRGVLDTCTPAQPTVAFEASPETDGESCRDPVGRLRELAGQPLGDGFARALRDRAGGALGCSHLVTLALYMDGALRAGLARDRGLHPGRSGGPPVAAPLFRRDLLFECHERADGRVAVALRQGDLHWNERGPDALAPDRFAAHHELAARLEADLWPGALLAITGAERLRTADAFAGAAWADRAGRLAPLVGLGLARGATGEIVRLLGADPDAGPWRDALVMLAPALVQCRAAHPDAWHEKVRATPRHPGLTAIPDSCWMWRRDGALARRRAAHGAVKGGR